MRSIPEPYRIKVVERIELLDVETRAQRLEAAKWSVVHLASPDVYIDLITDSGTGAMSDRQWASLMQGDEAYFHSRSYAVFEKAVQDLTGYPHVIPVHQGRAAENLVMQLLVEADQIVPGNTHFDTTRAHIEHRGAVAVDCIGDHLWTFEDDEPFGGNLNLPQLEALLSRQSKRVPLVILTVLNNMACSAPVSLANVRGVREIAGRYGIALFLDAARCAENAYFIKKREAGQGHRSVRDILREMFEQGDGCWMSAKKDGIVNIGGFLATRNEELAEKARALLVLYEGFPSYGGLARRDLEAIAVGLTEATDEAHLRHRVGQVAYLADQLQRNGIVVSTPPGGSGVFVDVRALYPHLGPDDLPAVAFSCDLYLTGGVRAGAAPFRLTRVDPETGELNDRTFDFARLAIPRRVYTGAHLDHVAETLAEMRSHAAQTPGYRVVRAPKVLPHFFAEFAPTTP